MAEPTPIRDNGPYLDAAQAQAQFNAATFGLPSDAAPLVVLAESLLMAGVELSDLERRVSDFLGGALSPAYLQVVASWIIRANLAGRDSAPMATP